MGQQDGFATPKRDGLENVGHDHFAILGIPKNLVHAYMSNDEFTLGINEGNDVLSGAIKRLFEAGDPVRSSEYNIVIDNRTGDGERIKKLFGEVIAESDLSLDELHALTIGKPIAIAILDKAPCLGMNCRIDRKVGIQKMALNDDGMIKWILHHEIILHEVKKVPSENDAEKLSAEYLREKLRPHIENMAKSVSGWRPFSLNYEREKAFILLEDIIRVQDVTVIAIDNDPRIRSVYQWAVDGLKWWAPKIRCFDNVDDGIAAIEEERARYRALGVPDDQIDKKIFVVQDLFMGKKDGKILKGGITAINEMRADPGSAIELNKKLGFKGQILVLSGSSVSKAMFPSIFTTSVRDWGLGYEVKNENGSLALTFLRTMFDMLRRPYLVAEKIERELVMRDIDNEIIGYEIFSGIEIDLGQEIDDFKDLVETLSPGNKDAMLMALSNIKEQLLPPEKDSDNLYHDFNNAVAAITGADADSKTPFIKALKKEIEKISAPAKRNAFRDKMDLLSDKISAAVSFVWHAGEIKAVNRFAGDTKDLGEMIRDIIEDNKKNLRFNGRTYERREDVKEEQLGEMSVDGINVHLDVPYELGFILNAITRNAKEAYEENEGVKLSAVDKRDIEISIKQDGGKLIVSISDKAGGIKDISKIFEIGYTTKDPYRLGYGLYFAREMAMDKGMTIEAENKDGGAVFTVTLDLGPKTIPLDEDIRTQKDEPEPADELERKLRNEAADLGGKLAQLKRLESVCERRKRGRVASFRGIEISRGWKVFLEKNKEIKDKGDAMVRYYNSLVERVYDEFRDAPTESIAIKRVEGLAGQLKVKTMREIFPEGFFEALKAETGKISEKAIIAHLDGYLDSLTDSFVMPEELESLIDAETAALAKMIDERGEKEVSSGLHVGRSSGRREDSFRDNMAGKLLSEKAAPGEIRNTCKSILIHALREAWCEDKLLSDETGCAIIIQNYIKYKASGVVFTDLYGGHSTAEIVLGQTETAVSGYPNNTVYDLDMDGDILVDQPFNYAPHDILTSRGIKYSRESDPVGLLKYWYENTVETDGDIGEIRAPMEPEEARSIIEEAKAISGEEEFGYSLDMEMGVDINGGLWFQQARPLLLPREGYFELPELETDDPYSNAPPKDMFAGVNVCLGSTGENGFKGKIVIVNSDVKDEDIKRIDDHMEGKYILVAHDIASKRLGDNAYILIDPHSGGRTPHNVNRLSVRIRQGDIVYIPGYQLQEPLRLCPNYRELSPELPGVMVSNEEIEVWSNGIQALMKMRGAQKKLKGVTLDSYDMDVMSGAFDEFIAEYEQGHHLIDQVIKRISKLIIAENERMYNDKVYSAENMRILSQRIFRHVTAQFARSFIMSAHRGYSGYYHLDEKWNDLERLFMAEKYGQRKDVLAYNMRYTIAASFIMKMGADKYGNMELEFLKVIRDQLKFPLYPMIYDSKVAEVLRWYGFMADILEMYDSGELLRHVEEEIAERDRYMAGLASGKGDPEYDKLTERQATARELLSNLPAARSSAGPVERENTQAEQQVKILIFDDDRDTGDLVREGFELAFPDVKVMLCKKWGSEFFDILQSEKPDIVFMDLPPGEKYFKTTLFEHIKDISPGIKIILQTGAPIARESEVVDELFHKPYDKTELLACLGRYVDAAKALKSSQTSQMPTQPANDEREPTTDNRQPTRLRQGFGGQATEKPKVLIIDDNTTALTKMHKTLTESGCEVYRARSGALGLQRLSDVSRRYDFIVLDLVLRPGEEGMPLAIMNKAKAKGIGIIIISGNADIEAERRKYSDELAGYPITALGRTSSLYDEAAGQITKIAAMGTSDLSGRSDVSVSGDGSLVSTGGNPIKILLFDDHKQVLEDSVEWLTEDRPDSNFEVKGISFPDELEGALERIKPDILVMDTLDNLAPFPKTWSIVAKAQEINPNICIIILSGHKPALIRDSMPTDGDMSNVVILGKPVSYDDYLGEIDNAAQVVRITRGEQLPDEPGGKTGYDSDDAATLTQGNGDIRIVYYEDQYHSRDQILKLVRDVYGDDQPDIKETDNESDLVTLIEEDRPDILLLDSFGEANMARVIGRAREINPDIKVIIISGFAPGELPSLRGMAEFIYKGTSVTYASELIALIGRYIREIKTANNAEFIPVAEENPKPVENAGGVTVLVMDDELRNVSELVQLLDRRGKNMGIAKLAVCCSDTLGDYARAIDEAKPDIIVTDVLDGAEPFTNTRKLLDRARGYKPDLDVIVVSGRETIAVRKYLPGVEPSGRLGQSEYDLFRHIVDIAKAKNEKKAKPESLAAIKVLYFENESFRENAEFVMKKRFGEKYSADIVSTGDYDEMEMLVDEYQPDILILDYYGADRMLRLIERAKMYKPDLKVVISSARSGGELEVFRGIASIERKSGADNLLETVERVLKEVKQERDEASVVRQSPVEVDQAAKYEKIARNFVDVVLSRALSAKKRGEKIIVGLDESWLPPKDGGLEGVISAIMRLSEPLGIEGIIIEKGSGEALKDKLIARAGENIDYSNILVLGSTEITVRDGIFDKLIDPKSGNKAFLVGVNPLNLNKANNGEICFSKIVEILTAAMELAYSGSEIIEKNIDGIKADRLRSRVWLFVPDAVSMPVDKLIGIYAAQTKPIEAAA
ncbi:MAG: hypothetical protein HQL30_00410 [Candidatus Omnitrophica bacterium]|nr:hypothetical protein [Candidatus Omnitrophota bacterium]